MVVAKTKVYFRDGDQLVLHIYSMVGGDKCVEVEARREESGPEAVGRAVGAADHDHAVRGGVPGVAGEHLVGQRGARQDMAEGVQQLVSAFFYYIVKATSTVAAALGCMGPGAVMADLLSKAQFREFRIVAGEVGWPGWVTGALLRWLMLQRERKLSICQVYEDLPVPQKIVSELKCTVIKICSDVTYKEKVYLILGQVCEDIPVPAVHGGPHPPDPGGGLPALHPLLLRLRCIQRYNHKLMIQ